MTIVYKLTTQGNKTRKGHVNETTWGRGVTHTAKGRGGLCTDGVIHGYTSPLLAVLMHPNHADIRNPKLWEAEMEITANDRGLKIGGKTMTTIREIDLPVITNRQKVIFAILCAKAGFEAFDPIKNLRIRDEVAAKRYIEKRQKYEAWAEAYIRGDATAKTRGAAYAAANAANAAAYAANAANAAANAAAYAAYAAYAAANAAYAAAYAANAANAAPIDFDRLASLAMELGNEVAVPATSGSGQEKN